MSASAIIRLDLTPDEAIAVMGALNVSATLRNTIAPVTLEQLDRGKVENELAMRVLNAVAKLAPTDNEGEASS